MKLADKQNINIYLFGFSIGIIFTSLKLLFSNSKPIFILIGFIACATGIIMYKIYWTKIHREYGESTRPYLLKNINYFGDIFKRIANDFAAILIFVLNILLFAFYVIGT